MRWSILPVETKEGGVNDTSYPDDIVEAVKIMAVDHSINGWPAVNMRDLAKWAQEASSLRSSLSSSEARVKELQGVCAEAYQFAGAYNAPAEVLDNLAAAAAGDPLPHKTFLPVIAADVDSLREELESRIENEHELFLAAHRDNMRYANRQAEMRKALVEAAIPLEALRVAEGSGPILSSAVKAGIRKALTKINAALKKA